MSLAKVALTKRKTNAAGMMLDGGGEGGDSGADSGGDTGYDGGFGGDDGQGSGEGGDYGEGGEGDPDQGDNQDWGSEEAPGTDWSRVGSVAAGTIIGGAVAGTVGAAVGGKLGGAVYDRAGNAVQTTVQGASSDGTMSPSDNYNGENPIQQNMPVEEVPMVATAPAEGLPPGTQNDIGAAFEAKERARKLAMPTLDTNPQAWTAPSLAAASIGPAPTVKQIAGPSTAQIGPAAQIGGAGQIANVTLGAAPTIAGPQNIQAGSIAGVALGATPQMQAASVQGAQVNNQFRDAQGNIINQLQQQAFANPNGPNYQSLAQLQLQQGLEKGIAASQAQLASQRGGFDPAAFRQAQQSQQEMVAQTQMAAAQTAAQEQLQQEQLSIQRGQNQIKQQEVLAGLAGSARGADVSVAALAQDASLANAKFQQDASGQNAQLSQQSNLTQAQLDQERQLTQARLNQEAATRNAELGQAAGFKQADVTQARDLAQGQISQQTAVTSAQLDQQARTDQARLIQEQQIKQAELAQASFLADFNAKSQAGLTDAQIASQYGLSLAEMQQQRDMAVFTTTARSLEQNAGIKADLSKALFQGQISMEQFKQTAFLEAVKAGASIAEAELKAQNDLIRVGQEQQKINTAKQGGNNSLAGGLIGAAGSVLASVFS